MKPELIEEYIALGSVRFEYRDYAFRGPEAELAAEASVCAEEQGEFWRFHNTIFANQGQQQTGNFTESRLRAMAEGIGLDLDAYDACMASDQPEEFVAAELAEAKEQGVTGTPALVVNGRLIGWNGWEELKLAIDEVLAAEG